MKCKVVLVLAVCSMSLGISAAADESLEVSPVQLLATPERFEGRLVRVEGFLHCQFEDMALYLSKPDGDHLIGMNAVWLSFSKNLTFQGDKVPTKLPVNVMCSSDQKYVLVEGRFNSRHKGHLGSYSGAIDEVTRLMELRKWFK